ncbi:ClpP/crotonase-like domain-containing protein [Umbelopsis sp. PMI_123]|nr:ClpP/crotonase-like domain-containing protein [Umbelopsis sp. PMI_123]
MAVDIPKLETFEIKLHRTGVAEIIFNRPQRYNALSRLAYAEWLAAIRWAARCDEAKVTIITGNGKYYTSGQELTMPEPLPEAEESDDMLAIAKKGSSNTKALIDEMINFPKLLIAAVNGPAIGFGVTTLALCDVVYSVPHATFKTPFMQLGFCAEGCSSYLFPRILGPSRASEMLLMNRQFTAQELEQTGFVGRILPADGFHEQVLKLATDAAKFSLEALKTTKKLVRDADRELLLKVNEEEIDRLAERMTSPDSLQKIMEFIENAQRKKQQKLKSASKL